MEHVLITIARLFVRQSKSIVECERPAGCEERPHQQCLRRVLKDFYLLPIGSRGTTIPQGILPQKIQTEPTMHDRQRGHGLRHVNESTRNALEGLQEGRHVVR